MDNKTIRFALNVILQLGMYAAYWFYGFERAVLFGISVVIAMALNPYPKD
jgi:hypothetical protein